MDTSTSKTVGPREATGEQPQPSPTLPVDSAAVILLRAGSVDGEAEVLLLRRHLGSSSFAGAFVFPGGHVDGGDAESRLMRALDLPSKGTVRRKISGSVASQEALTFRVAAIRELFEEAGVLLARQEDGLPIDFTDQSLAARFDKARQALCKGEKRFCEFVEEEALTLKASSLTYFSRWITPTDAPSRFDTRFFVAPMPPDQKPFQDDREMTEAKWLSPAAALAQAANGDLLLFPPTVRTLEELATLGCVESVIETSQLRKIQPILPKIVNLGGTPAILLPEDPCYQDANPREKLPAGGKHKTRMAIVNGRWRTLA